MSSSSSPFSSSAVSSSSAANSFAPLPTSTGAPPLPPPGLYRAPPPPHGAPPPMGSSSLHPLHHHPHHPHHPHNPHHASSSSSSSSSSLLLGYSHPPPVQQQSPSSSSSLPLSSTSSSPSSRMSLLGPPNVGGSGGNPPPPPPSGLTPQQQAQQQQQQSRHPLFNRDRKLDPIHMLNFDPNEFPSLNPNSAPNPSLSARPNYVGMVKQPAMESSEFTMSHEDFPALPGSAPAGSNSNNAGGGVPGVGGMMMDHLPNSHQGHHVGGNGAPGGGNDRMTSQGLHQDNSNLGVGTAVSQAVAQEGNTVTRKGIQTSPDGSVKNIPSSMVTDQFGMIGLLTFIRAAETDPNLVSLALGADLTTLGLNLNSEVNLYPTFGGPWAETPCRPQDIDYHVPHEYLTNQAIRDKLAPVKLNRYKDDVLFYMFYTNVGDVLQLAAAAELYNRDWRFHREDRVWITRAPGMAPSEQTSTYERGTYFFFDVTTWRKVPKEFHLDYDKLEDRPSLPQTLIGSGGTPAASSGVLAAGANNANSSNGAGVGPGGIPHGPSPVHMNENNNAPGPAAGGPQQGRQQQHSPSVLAAAASLMPGGGSGVGSDGRPPQF